MSTWARVSFSVASTRSISSLMLLRRSQAIAFSQARESAAVQGSGSYSGPLRDSTEYSRASAEASRSPTYALTPRAYASR